MGDHDADIRDAVAEIIGDWAGGDINIDVNIMDLIISAILQDLGTRAARRMTYSLKRAGAKEVIQRHRKALDQHISGRVRHPVD